MFTESGCYALLVLVCLTAQIKYLNVVIGAVASKIHLSSATPGERLLCCSSKSLRSRYAVSP